MSGFIWNGAIETIAENAVGKQVGRGGFLALAERAKELMEPFVPMDTGALVKSAKAYGEDLRGVVVYDAPHASAVYYGGGTSFGTDKHPQATAYWDRAVTWK